MKNLSRTISSSVKRTKIGACSKRHFSSTTSITKFASAFCHANEAGLSSSLEKVSETLNGARPDLILAMANCIPDSELEVLLGKLDSENKMVVSVGNGIMGNGEEEQGEPSVALMAAVLPETDVVFFQRNELDGLPELPNDRGWADYMMEDPGLLFFVNPQSFKNSSFLKFFDSILPRGRFVGGLLPNSESKVILNGTVYSEGIAGVLLSGRVKMRSLVAQGAVPTGAEYIITSCSENAVLTLNGKPALSELTRHFHNPERPEGAVVVGVFPDTEGLAGEVQDRSKDAGGTEYVIRHIAGADRNSGAIMLSTDNIVRKGMKLRFYVFSRQAAEDELQQAASTYLDRNKKPPMAYFSSTCVGRGVNLYGRSNTEPEILSKVWGDGIPCAGFFAGSEFGHVGERSYLHSYTTCLALFQDSINEEPVL